MISPSPKIETNQQTIHQDLAKTLKKRSLEAYRKPVHPRSRESFQHFLQWYTGGPWLFDTGCGTGDSTHLLAKLFPDHQILGVDQSLNRLERGANRGLDHQGENYLLLRADLVDFWLLLWEHKIFPQGQYLLYPNPWPRKEHLARRWHGHPVFPFILALGGRIEVRTNWALYLEEWDFAASFFSHAGQIKDYIPKDPWTPFEKKFWESGHSLYLWESK